MKTAHLKAFKALKSQYKEFNHEPIEQVFKRMLLVKAPDLSLEQQSFKPSWQRDFNLEKYRLLQGVSNVFNAFHIGSTSIQGMTAKDVIDIILVVDCQPTHEALLSQLAELGYQNYGVSPISSDAIWCWRILEEVSYVVHICHSNNPCTELIVAFPEYLNKNRQAQLEYVVQKQRLISSEQDLLSYSVSKLGIYCHFFKMAGQWKAKQPGGLALVRHEKSTQ
ncbi:GrpB family protein [Pseudoalteromonas sp. JBTF-M23]|uniref:GrpB family protein n=1 Tax=Pseudoalteromonas caenipelagi TaxID=2726988 RepID=A0A849VHK6_9GAMM|nr:GrpB family protein [Pseudoalteromonas caenipelagi]NOU51953.1 GrpB family protein [Pseudoalteromonas caenipelagi]